MNTNLLLAMGCLQQAAVYITKAETELYMDDLVSENDNAMMALNKAIAAIYSAYYGVKDDVICELDGTNHKEKVTYVDFNRKEVQ